MKSAHIPASCHFALEHKHCEKRSAFACPVASSPAGDAMRAPPRVFAHRDRWSALRLKFRPLWRTKRLARKRSLAIFALVLLVVSMCHAVTGIGGSVGHQRRLVDPKDQFTNDQRRSGAVILHCMGLLYMFVGIAIVCDECFVPALEVIIEVLELSPDVAGATFMAAGGSAPEFFTSLIGAVLVESDIGTGTIIGSAVFNVLFVIGACAVVAPEPLHLTWFPLARDSLFYAVDLIAVTAVFLDEEVRWWESLVLFSLYIAYAITMKFSERIERYVVKRPVSEDVQEETDQSTWAYSREVPPNADLTMPPSDDMQVCVEDLAADAAAAGTGEGGGRPVSKTRTKEMRNSANSDKEHKQFRHKSIRVVHHEKLHHAIHLSATSGTNDFHPGIDDDSTGGSTGGSYDPPAPTEALTGVVPAPSPPGSAPKLNAEWEVTDVIQFQQDRESDSCEIDLTKDMTKDFSSKKKVGVEASTTTSMGNNASVAGATFTCEGRQEASPDDATEAGEDEDDEPLSFWPPDADAGIKDWIWYLFTFPLVFCLCCTVPDVRRDGYRRFFVLTFFMAITWIAAFTWVMVWFATAIAETCGLDETIMGLTVLAAGTSVPDLLTSVIVARQGHGDMAISSSIGSNIFDVTVGLPVPWMLYCAVRRKPVQLKNEGLEIMVMLLLSMLFFTIGSVVCHNWVMTKWMGASLLVLYVCFEGVAVGLTFAPEGSLTLIHV